MNKVNDREVRKCERQMSKRLLDAIHHLTNTLGRKPTASEVDQYLKKHREMAMTQKDWSDSRRLSRY